MPSSHSILQTKKKKNKSIWRPYVTTKCHRNRVYRLADLFFIKFIDEHQGNRLFHQYHNRKAVAKIHILLTRN